MGRARAASVRSKLREGAEKSPDLFQPDAFIEEMSYHVASHGARETGGMADGKSRLRPPVLYRAQWHGGAFHSEMSGGALFSYSGEKQKGAEDLRPLGNRTPGNNRYRCFLSDLAGLAARPPSGSLNSLSESHNIRAGEDCQAWGGAGLFRPSVRSPVSGFLGHGAGPLQKK